MQTIRNRPGIKHRGITIRQRADGPHFFLCVPDPDRHGKSVRRYAGRTIKEALARRADLLARIHRDGTLQGEPTNRNLLLRDFAERWLKALDERVTTGIPKRLKPTSRDRLRENVRILLEHFSDHRLASVRELAVEQFIKARREAGCRHRPGRPINNATINRDLAALRQIINAAQRAHVYIGDNPVKLLQERPAVLDVLPDQADFDRLIGCCKAVQQRTKGPALADVVLFLRWTGCRLGECLSLHVRDLDYDRRTLTFRDTKTGDDRTLDLTDAPHVFQLLGWQRPIEGFVFGGPGQANRVKHAWASARVAAGLPKLRLHDLRHLAVSWMREQGADDLTIMAVTGHKTRAMIDRYSHARQRQTAHGLALLGRRLDTICTKSAPSVVPGAQAEA